METYISENGQFVTHRDLSRFAEMVDERFLAIEQELLDSSFAKEFIIKDGQKVEADLAYIEIYQQAKKSLIMIDGYISLKTLHLLSHVSNGVKITIITEKILNIKII